MEVVDAVLGSLCRWPDEQFDVGAALSIPYGLMAFGMTLLTVQLLLQVAIGAGEMGKPAGHDAPLGSDRTGGHA